MPQKRNQTFQKQISENRAKLKNQLGNSGKNAGEDGEDFEGKDDENSLDASDDKLVTPAKRQDKRGSAEKNHKVTPKKSTPNSNAKQNKLTRSHTSEKKLTSGITWDKEEKKRVEVSSPDTPSVSDSAKKFEGRKKRATCVPPFID